MRRRMVHLTVLAAVLVVTLFGFPLAVAGREYAIANQLGSLERVAEATAQAVAAGLVRNKPPGVLPDMADGVVLALYDHDGTRILGAGPEAAPGESIHDQVIDEEVQQAFVVAVPVIYNGHVIGVVRAASPRTNVDQFVGLVWLGMIVLAGVAVGAAYVLARREAEKLARPLEELSTAARRIGDGDFSVRVAPFAIPEIDTVGDSLNTTARRLDDVLQRERAFSANASHQLRTPLAGLRLELDAALDVLQGAAPRSLVSAVGAVDRLQQTVDDLLALARGNQHSHDRVDIREVIEEAEREWNCRTEIDQRPIRVDIGPKSPRCAVAGTAVRQILAVLLDNAAQHGDGMVTVTVRDAGEVLAIDVSDQGPGVALPDSELFVRRAGAAKGHGIGLPFARTLAEAEGGRLKLTSARPATFTLFLPEAGPLLGEE